jgi:adenylosuccinate lyase
MNTVPANVLADRYATAETIAIWSPQNKTLLLRDLWIADLKIRKKMGFTIPDEVVAAYEAVKNVIDLDSITARELKLKHDVMANIAEFNALAGHQRIHDGFTSRDETDNTEQLQILQSLRLMRDRLVALLGHLNERMMEFDVLAICGRSHLVPAQTITLGKRIGNCIQELLIAFEDLERFINTYPLRGIKGPMGTQQDMIVRLGSPEKALEYENLIREYFGFEQVLTCVGQVYPRMLDFKAAGHVASIASAPANFAKMVRLMAGLGLSHEGFKDEQAGSSAMPHKVNSRTCERITGLLNVINGYGDMLSRLLGDQWLEGDVSCSVVRRVALPDMFYALDGLLEAAMHVAQEMEVFPTAVHAELDKYLPFLSTTGLLSNATKKGLGREDAHKIIKTSSQQALKDMRSGEENTLLERLARADSVHFPIAETTGIIDKIDYGASVEQVREMTTMVEGVLLQYPEAAEYTPRELR